MSGIAISTMCNGFCRMVSPWKENRRMSVRSNPHGVTLSNLCTNTSSKYSLPRLLIIIRRVAMAVTSGITTKSSTESSSVAQGMVMPQTPNSRATIGENATRMMRSFTATCTSVYEASPLVRWLHTKTIAVQVAAPSSTAPAR